MYRIATVVALLACLPGCDAVLTPDLATGAYALRSGSSDVLQNPSVRIQIVADTLWLQGDGTARRVLRQFLDYGTYPDTTLTSEESYRYRRSGRTIEFEYQCPPNALCSAPPHLWGKIGVGEMELRSAFDPRALLRYRRFGD